MPATTLSAAKADRVGPLWQDRAYHGMNITQFLGAFNDNLFKQLVLLICVGYAGSGTDYQGMAQALFALPFVLFSGFAGFLSDRIGKQRIVVAMKVAEIAVMTAGFFAFHAQTGQLPWMLLVVFLMGTHSAFFGPPKYGILPELFRESDLPQVNGMIQMTTFLAIICGAATAGMIKEWYGSRLWVGSALCIGIAVVGTLTSLFVRKTPVARPDLRFTPSALFLGRETWQMIWQDRPLFKVLMVSSLFWFLGGVIQPSVNAFGKAQLHYGDGRTSVMVVCMAIGIMIGCLWAGQSSRGKIRFDFVARGAWGIVACLAAIAVLGGLEGSVLPAKPRAAAAHSAAQASEPSLGPSTVAEATAEAAAGEPFVQMIVPISPFEWIARALLIGIGLSAGFFYVPLAVFMQVRPPEDKKGRMIGAMNLINWIGIVISAGFYSFVTKICSPQMLNVRESWIFAVCALVMLPIAVVYRPSASARVDWP